MAINHDMLSRPDPTPVEVEKPLYVSLSDGTPVPNFAPPVADVVIGTYTPHHDNDLPQLAHLQYLLAEEECPGTNLHIPTLLRGLIANEQSNERGYIVWILAKILDEVVGCMRVTYVWSDWHAQTRGIIDGVCVLPAYRRQGIAEKMIRSVVDRHRDYQFELHVKNPAAFALYQKIGFTHEYEYRIMSIPANRKV